MRGRPKSAFQFSTPYKERKAGKVPRGGSGSFPVSQPSIEGGKLENWNGCRLLAELLARGYLRLRAMRAAEGPHPPRCLLLPDAMGPQNYLDVAGRSKHELDGSSPIRRH
jgi:hypothetical protein